MKIFKSLDFKSQQERIEPNTAGEYLVHLEDYESLNDLIRRSVRTKSVFRPESDKNALYDDVLDEFDDEFQKIIDRNQQDEVKSEQTKVEVEQSEDETKSLSSDVTVSAGLL